MDFRPALLALIIALASFPGIAKAAPEVNLTVYYGIGCPHCDRTIDTLFSLAREYNLTIEGREVYTDPTNHQRMLAQYASFGLDPEKGGVPTTVVGNRSFVIGEISEARWKEIFSYCQNGSCMEGVFTQDSFSPIDRSAASAQQLNIPMLIGAALVDSVNPCTIAIMVMLLGVVLAHKGRREALVSCAAFCAIIFACYLLLGLGILTLFSSRSLSGWFFALVTVLAFALSAFEILSYFKYRPGFFSLEMPLFLRPYAEKALAGATSLPGVAAAALLSAFFLLPCSSGPYLMVLGTLAKSASRDALLHLAVYNFVFVLPMLAIAAAVCLGKVDAKAVSGLEARHEGQIHLISGLILFLLFLLMLQQIIGIA